MAVELRKKTIESHPSGEEVMRIVMEKYGKKTVLGFSRGKDSIACWIALRDFGFEVVPYHNMLCPGLSFVEESLGYYEKFFGVHIRRIPHPTLYRYLNQFIMQTPDTAAVIMGARLPDFDSIFTEREIVKEDGLPDGTAVRYGSQFIGRACEAPRDNAETNQEEELTMRARKGAKKAAKRPAAKAAKRGKARNKASGDSA